MIVLKKYMANNTNTEAKKLLFSGDIFGKREMMWVYM
jgi:hypothetical protein